MSVGANEYEGLLGGETLRCPLCIGNAGVVLPALPLLGHLLQAHHVAVADPHTLADAQAYLDHYLASVASEAELAARLVCITTRPLNPGDPEGKYYMLDRSIPGDEDLRSSLKMQALAALLNENMLGRATGGPPRRCLFCRNEFSGPRAPLLEHLRAEHGLRLGLADNIVHLELFLDRLQARVDALQCIYCQRTFRDRGLLKEHMRKKKHFKIHPRNKEYDRFYLINYAEPGRDWETLKRDRAADLTTIGGLAAACPHGEFPDGDDEAEIENTSGAAEVDDEDIAGADEDDEEPWDDWVESGAAALQPTLCIFCDEELADAASCLEHLAAAHEFNLVEIASQMALSSYARIKLINYCRHQVTHYRCLFCDAVFSSRASLMQHMSEEGHLRVEQTQTFWERAEYFFPTLEGDPLLCCAWIDDETGDSEAEEAETAALLAATHLSPPGAL